MTDSEKSTALKKAYADIILNTAKEAAARVMVSERKAMRYQHELFAAKDEALRMMLRLKQMLDFKVNEAATTSLNQQKKIEELEAQLGEAEDIVRDLRAELREAQDELEKATKNQMRQIADYRSKRDIITEETSQETLANSFGSAIPSIPDAKADILAASGMKNMVFNGTTLGDKCGCKDNCYACNPDFASIVIRRKEPDLYRNGCTQRIRALERSLLNGKFSLPLQVDSVKNVKSTRDNAEGKDICAKVAPEADNMCRPEKKSRQLKVPRTHNNFIPVHAVNSFHGKRKRGTRYKKSKASSSNNVPDQSAELCQEAVDSDAESVEDPRIIKHDTQGGLVSLSTTNSPLDTTTIGITQLERSEARKGDLELFTANSPLDTTTNKDLLTQETESAQNLDVPSSKAEHEILDVSVVNADVKSSDLAEGLCTEPTNNKFLKYTFVRKRKKESLSSPDRESSFDDEISRRKAVERKNDSLESHNSSLMAEPFPGIQRLAQVAHELISLSGK